MNNNWQLLIALKFLALLGLTATPGIGHCDLSATAKRGFFQNMAKVRSVHRDASDERGWGIIMLETGGDLLIAIPKHVVIDEDALGEPLAEKISVTLFDANESIPAHLEKSHDLHDIALLRITKPIGFNWNYAKLSVNASRGDTVWLLGHDWSWEVQSQSIASQVTNVSRADLEVSSEVKVNMSGGLVVTDEGIAGMIIENKKDERKVIAHRMDFLVEIVLHGWLGTEVKKLVPPKDYPHFGIDGGGYMSVLLTSFDEENLPIGYGTKLGMDVVWSPLMGIRLTHSRGQFSSESEFALTSQSANFRNEIEMTMIYWLFSFENELSETPFFREQGEPILNGYVGLGVGKHDPRLNINGAGLRRLDSYPEFEGEYQDDFHVLDLGFRVEQPVNRYLSWGADVGFTFTDNKYLGINVDDPFAVNDVADFMFNLGVYLRLTLGKGPKPTVKALY